MQQPLLEHRLVCGRAVVALGIPRCLPGDSFHPDPSVDCPLVLDTLALPEVYITGTCVPAVSPAIAVYCSFPGWVLALFCGQLVPSLISGFVFTRGWIYFVACSLGLPLTLSSVAAPRRHRDRVGLSGEAVPLPAWPFQTLWGCVMFGGTTLTSWLLSALRVAHLLAVP